MKIYGNNQCQVLCNKHNYTTIYPIVFNLWVVLFQSTKWSPSLYHYFFLLQIRFPIEIPSSPTAVIFNNIYSISTKYAYSFVILCFVVVTSSVLGGFLWYINSFLFMVTSLALGQPYEFLSELLKQPWRIWFMNPIRTSQHGHCWWHGAINNYNAIVVSKVFQLLEWCLDFKSHCISSPVVSVCYRIRIMIDSS